MDGHEATRRRSSRFSIGFDEDDSSTGEYDLEQYPKHVDSCSKEFSRPRTEAALGRNAEIGRIMSPHHTLLASPTYCQNGQYVGAGSREERSNVGSSRRRGRSSSLPPQTHYSSSVYASQRHIKHAQNNSTRAFSGKTNEQLSGTHQPADPETVMQMHNYKREVLGRSMVNIFKTDVDEHGRGTHEGLLEMEKNKKLVQAIEDIQSLSYYFKEIISSVLLQKKEVGRVLLKVQSSYLQIFEDLLSAALTLHWNKRKALERQIFEQGKRIGVLSDDNERLTAKLEVATQMLSACEALNKGQAAEIEALNLQVGDLRNFEEKYWRKVEDERLAAEKLAEEKRRQELRRKLEQESKRELELEMARTLREQQSREAEERRLQLESERLKLLQMQRSRCREAHDASTQTQVDPDGYWDVQVGVPKFVTAGTISRLLWHKLRSFVTCPLCRKHPRHINPSIAESLHGMSRNAPGVQWKLIGNDAKTNAERKQMKNRGTSDELVKTEPDLTIWSSKDKKSIRRRKVGDGKAIWSVPQYLRSFVSNIPCTVQAIPIRQLGWLVNTIHYIYDRKREADLEDARDGRPVQELGDFLVELYLFSHGTRQQAELRLYELLQAVRKYFILHRAVFMFGRFVGLIYPHKKVKKDTAAKKSSFPLLSSLISTGKDVVSANDNDDDGKASKKKFAADSLEQILDKNYQAVFLFFRDRLKKRVINLKEKEGHTETSRVTFRRKSSIQAIPGGKKTKGESRKSSMHSAAALPEHSTIVSSHADPEYHIWVSLRDAISLLRSTFESSIKKKELQKKSRDLEYKAKILQNGKVEDLYGNRLIVRAEVRKFQEEDGSSSSASDVEAQTTEDDRSLPALSIPKRSESNKLTEHNHQDSGGAMSQEQSDRSMAVVDFDVVMEAVVAILESRGNQAAHRLARLFMEGDENKDGVLSFQEFSDIVSPLMPLAKQRTILCMFKEALTGGSSSYVIEEKTFVQVCRNHGLVRLVNFDVLGRERQFTSRSQAEFTGTARGSVPEVSNVASIGASTGSAEETSTVSGGDDRVPQSKVDATSDQCSEASASGDGSSSSDAEEDKFAVDDEYNNTIEV